MAPLFVSQMLVNEHIRAISWTLIHSLWIGFLTAALAGLLMTLTRKSSAKLRYRLLCGSLLLFVLLVGYVFMTKLQTVGNTSHKTSNLSGNVFLENPDFVHPGINVAENDFISVITSRVNQYSGWIFAFWLAFFLFKSVNTIGALLYIRRIRTKQVDELGEAYTEKINSFCQQLGINRTVRLLQSGLIKVPVTVGHFKPVILIPLGLILQLPPQQIDTILWHELAHIHRKDYLVNLLQNIAEAVFFFNPGILWVSAQIRDERENCCDDLVLAHTSVKSNYLEALLAFHHSQPLTSSHTLALGLEGNQLANRLKRIIYNENKRLNTMEKILLITGVVVASAFSYLPEELQVPKIAAKPEQNVSVQLKTSVENPLNREISNDVKVSPVIKIKPAVSTQDSTKKLKSIRFSKGNADMLNQEITGVHENGKEYTASFTDRKLKALKIDGQPVPESELPKHEGLYDEMMAAFDKAREEKKNAMEKNLALSQEKRRAEVIQNDLKMQEKQDRLSDIRKEKELKLQKTESDKLYELKKDKEEKYKLKDDKLSRVEFDRASDRQKEKEEKYKLKEDKLSRVEFDRKEDKGEWKKEKERQYQLRDDKLSRMEFDRKEDKREWKKEKEAKYKVKEDKLSRIEFDKKEKKEKIEKEEKPEKVEKEEKPEKPEKMEKIEKEEKWQRKDDERSRSKEQNEALRKKRMSEEVNIKGKKLPNEKDYLADLARVNGVINELLEARVVAKPKEVEWFGLSEEELVVNGKKQSAELQARLKNKYGIKPGNGLYYGPVKMTGTGVFLDK